MHRLCSWAATLCLVSCATTPSLPVGPGITLGEREETPTAFVYELTWAAPVEGWQPAQAYAVVPRTSAPGPGIVYFHLYGAGGDWTEFREEALAAAQKGVRSILLTGRVPWDQRFEGTAADLVKIDAQMVELRQAVALLTKLPGVDLSRLAFVGHDYGAMYGAMLSSEVTPLQAFALVAAAPDFDDWIVYFNRDRAATAGYSELLGHRSPVLALKAKPDVPRFLQFTRGDQFVARDRAEVLAKAAPTAVFEVLENSSHSRVALDGAASRLQWIFSRWGLRSPAADLVPTIAVAGPSGRYLLGTTEVTQAQWKGLMTNNPSWYKGDQLPMEMTNWYEAVDFCNKLSLREGLAPAYRIDGEKVTPIEGSPGWRLPTSAEWEWAAQGGALSNKTLYAGSDVAEEVGWTSENAAETTHEVAQKAPNELGFYDMTGNVREWCFEAGPDETTRVYRGGGFILGERYLKIDYVDDLLAVYHNNDLGFRIARTLP